MTVTTVAMTVTTVAMTATTVAMTSRTELCKIDGELIKTDCIGRISVSSEHREKLLDAFESIGMSGQTMYKTNYRSS